MSADETVVSLSGVDVHFETDSGINPFADPETVRAVDDIDLEIAENDVVAIVGESGSGKTTLGKTAVGLQKPTGGTVSYRGQDISEARNWFSKPEIPFSEIRRSLQIIHQDPESSLNPHKSVRSSLEQPLKKWQTDLGPEDREARILAMLERVGMSPPHDYAQRYPHQLSGGETQRVALVRALLMNPDLILADEAVSALDVSLRVEMMDLMLDLQDSFDTSFLFISHDLSNARYVAEHAGGRLGVMYLGELVEIGPVEEVLQNPQHPYTKVLKWATPSLEIGDSTEPPIREIDIPDPVNPPSACRFHTRCPNATTYCQETAPEPLSTDGSDRRTACHRVDEESEYWQRSPLEGARLDR
ncbi:oligopeptide/dipeptide ABC transporter ATP-binding protein [Natronococcus pandeyae]|uniref:oligopeptide/dipeptide ABC transporter ATP-binding protein n=1 Tax=Natronococcus pandeyae TaxID=2055836 RepID=UPI001653083E|nr:oligopeptide/dipeptide ABC transporter ATP-binding protein [Natronococcus pandeyae]